MIYLIEACLRDFAEVHDNNNNNNNNYDYYYYY